MDSNFEGLDPERSHCVQGNVILTDKDYEVMVLLRSHRDDNRGLVIMPKHPYPLQVIRARIPLSEEQLNEALSAAKEATNLRGWRLCRPFLAL